nr:plasmid pRiA4b ORF-3 family protein [Rhizobium sp. MHM7A]
MLLRHRTTPSATTRTSNVRLHITRRPSPWGYEATGRCPPEDVGGPWGYQEFREALADPAHERHAELTEWWGAKDFDPNNAAFADLNRAVENLAAKWARRSRRKN